MTSQVIWGGKLLSNPTLRLYKIRGPISGFNGKGKMMYQYIYSNIFWYQSLDDPVEDGVSFEFSSTQKKGMMVP